MRSAEQVNRVKKEVVRKRTASFVLLFTQRPDSLILLTGYYWNFSKSAS